jgi:FKBP-type peptidyl-prolyl cis-trans isomerase
MKLESHTVFAIILLTVFSAIAREPSPEPKTPEAPDKEKVSYALGMRTALDAKQGGGDIYATVFAQALKDVLAGNPSRMDETEMSRLLNKGRSDGLARQAAYDPEKVSYALGMRLGMQLKRVGAEVDADTISRALKDVAGGKPTLIQESEIAPLFQQAAAYNFAKLASANKAAADPFLAHNAAEPGIIVLPDGLQYRVLKTGAGEIPSTNDMLFVKYRGTFIDGKEFDRHDRFLTRSDGGIKGWQDALQRMKVGSKWQIFVPAELAFGHEGESHHHIGPDTALVYELELLSIATGNDLQMSSGVGHGLDVGVSKPEPAK